MSYTLPIDNEKETTPRRFSKFTIREYVERYLFSNVISIIAFMPHIAPMQEDRTSSNAKDEPICINISDDEDHFEEFKAMNEIAYNDPRLLEMRSRQSKYLGG